MFPIGPDKPLGGGSALQLVYCRQGRPLHDGVNVKSPTAIAVATFLIVSQETPEQQQQRINALRQVQRAKTPNKRG